MHCTPNATWRALVLLCVCLASGLASACSWASSIQPLPQAISSGQHTRRPCRASMVSMKLAASSKEPCVPVSSQA